LVCVGIIVTGQRAHVIEEGRSRKGLTKGNQGVVVVW